MMDGAFNNVALADVGKIVEKAKNLIREEKYGEAIEYLKAEIKQVKKLKNNGLESCYTFDELFQFDIFVLSDYLNIQLHLLLKPFFHNAS